MSLCYVYNGTLTCDAATSGALTESNVALTWAMTGFFIGFTVHVACCICDGAVSLINRCRGRQVRNWQ